MKKVLFALITGLLCFALFTGCENFGNGELADNISDLVDRSKAKDLEVIPYSEDDAGFNFKTKSVSGAKVGYEFELKYFHDDAISLLNGFEVFDSNSNELELGDSKENHKDCYIEIDTVEKICTVTVYKNIDSVEIRPVIESQPKVSFALPKNGDTVVGTLITPNTTSQIMKVGVEYIIQYWMDSGWIINYLTAEKDSIQLSEAEFARLFEVSNESTNVRKVTAKTSEADGCVIVAKVTEKIGEIESTDGPEILTGRVNRSTSLSDLSIAVNGKFQVSLAFKDGKKATKYKVIERCMELTSDMIVQDKNGNWIEVPESGIELFNDYGEFLRSDIFNASDFYDSTGESLSVEVKVKKGGIHQWEIYAVDDNGMSRKPFKFSATVVNNAKSLDPSKMAFSDSIKVYSTFIGITFNPSFLPSDYLTSGNNNSYTFNESNIDSTILAIWESQGRKTYINNKLTDFYIKNENSGSLYNYCAGGLERNTNYQLSLTLVNDYGFRSPSEFKVIFKTRKVIEGEIAAFVGNDLDTVKYLSLEEYNKYKEEGVFGINPFAIVTYAKNNRIYGLAPAKCVEGTMYWSNKSYTSMMGNANFISFIKTQANITDPKEANEKFEDFLNQYGTSLGISFPAYSNAKAFADHYEYNEDEDGFPTEKTLYFDYDFSSAVKWMLPTFESLRSCVNEFDYFTTDSSKHIITGKRKFDDLAKNFVLYGSLKWEPFGTYWTANSTFYTGTSIYHGKLAGDTVSDTFMKNYAVRPVCDLSDFNSY